ncbi:MAG: hypothetical protein IPP78_16035 [Holophagaceae bacterium]|nr:hypothetical protein [Holophagaceae bacterium]
MNLSLLQDTLPLGAALGEVEVPGSKSVTNRALLLAAMAPGTSILHGGLEAEDTRWMRECLWTLGLPVVELEDAWSISGGFAPNAAAPLYVGASGTTLRFLLPWLALSAKVPMRINGAARLFERPLGPLLAPLLALGAKWKLEGNGAWLHPVPETPEQLEVAIDGSLSSQFITGLALATAGLRRVAIFPGTNPSRAPAIWRSHAIGSRASAVIANCGSLPGTSLATSSMQWKRCFPVIGAAPRLFSPRRP